MYLNTLKLLCAKKFSVQKDPCVEASLVKICPCKASLWKGKKVRRVDKRWEELRWVEQRWEEVRRVKQRWESLRRVKKRWEEVKRVELRWEEMKKLENSSEELWEEVRRAEMVWEELRRAEKWWPTVEKGEARWGGIHRTEFQRCVVWRQLLWANLVFHSYSVTFLAAGNFRHPPRAGCTCIPWYSHIKPPVKHWCLPILCTCFWCALIKSLILMTSIFIPYVPPKKARR